MEQMEEDLGLTVVPLSTSVSENWVWYDLMISIDKPWNCWTPNFQTGQTDLYLVKHSLYSLQVYHRLHLLLYSHACLEFQSLQRCTNVCRSCTCAPSDVVLGLAQDPACCLVEKGEHWGAVSEVCFYNIYMFRWIVIGLIVVFRRFCCCCDGR